MAEERVVAVVLDLIKLWRKSGLNRNFCFGSRNFNQTVEKERAVAVVFIHLWRKSGLCCFFSCNPTVCTVQYSHA